MITQYRPTVAEIDLGQLRTNLHLIRARLPRETAVVGVVKADAYGHGAVPVATALEQEGVRLLAVATAEEAVELREHGLRSEILVLGHVPADFVPYAAAHQVTLSISNAATAAAYGARVTAGALRLHFKVDTGMGRWGTIAADAADELERCAALPNVRVVGLYSHFACAEDDAAFTARQAQQFAGVVATARRSGLPLELVHIANSAAILNRSDVFWDAVRPGIVLYGYPPLPVPDLPVRPLLALRSAIDLVRTLPAGYGVGYERTFITKRSTQMAIVPIGYADGYLRGLSNRAHVIVRGHYAPVIGRVSMDVCSIDVTDIPGATVGDPVTLIGQQDGLAVTADELASLLGTISYEVLTGISRRVPRIYRDSAVQ